MFGGRSRHGSHLHLIPEAPSLAVEYIAVFRVLKWTTSTYVRIGYYTLDEHKW